ncbi:MAG: PIN domain-containing protein [Bacteroidales bacterium]|nr:PIN domain-containing protein [Bacteroidales bacterium]
MKVYAVYDTNILVSALLSRKPDSAVVLALETLLSGEVTPLYNDEILAEYDDVLHREQFKFPEDLVSGVVNQIKKDGIPSERISSGESFPDPDDAVFYEVALSKDEAFLVTGNTRHFPKTPIVVTPLEFLKILGKI